MGRFIGLYVIALVICGAVGGAVYFAGVGVGTWLHNAYACVAGQPESAYVAWHPIWFGFVACCVFLVAAVAAAKVAAENDDESAEGR